MVQWGEIHTHPMTVFFRIGLAALAALLPLGVLAQSLPNVTGIRAEQDNGAVTVHWDPVQADVKTYRVFYSHASILENGGMYDDYEDADGTTTQHTLSSVPAVPILYLSVLAVAEDGTESPFFQEEAAVELTPSAGGSQASSSSAASLPPSPAVPMQTTTLQLLTAVSTSATGVTLTFTHPVSVPEQYKEQAFAIKSGSGVALQVARYRLEGNQVLLDTEPQEAGRVYQVTIHGSLAGKTPTGELVPQDGATAPLLFTGQRTDNAVPEITNLKLVVKGKDVEATWTPPAGTIRELQIQQSTNGGRTFGTAVRMEKSSKGVTIPGVTSAQFTLLVRSVGLDGAVSRGVQQTVTIAGGAQSSSGPKSSASSSKSSAVSSTPATKPGTLPNSGLGLVTIVTLSGAATGMRFFRKKNAAQA